MLRLNGIVPAEIYPERFGAGSGQRHLGLAGRIEYNHDLFQT